MASRPLGLLLAAIAGAAAGSAATWLLVAPPSASLGPPRDAGPGPAAMTSPPPAAPPIEVTAAREALAMRLRSPDALVLEDVRVWRFGPDTERAVCGALRSPEVPGGGGRFVVRVLMPRERGDAGPGRQAPRVIVEDAPGLVRPTPEAARRFCREPAPELPAATPLTGAEPPAAAPAAPPALPPPVAATGDLGRVTTHSAANLRASPGGEVVGTVPRSRSLRVFDRAPGGWMQVGNDTPEGWIHASLLTDLASPP